MVGFRKWFSVLAAVAFSIGVAATTAYPRDHGPPVQTGEANPETPNTLYPFVFNQSGFDTAIVIGKASPPSNIGPIFLLAEDVATGVAVVLTDIAKTACVHDMDADTRGRQADADQLVPRPTRPHKPLHPLRI